MTWRVLAVLLPAACTASLVAHWVNQWADRTINRHVTTALDDGPDGTWAITPLGTVFTDTFDNPGVTWSTEDDEWGTATGLDGPTFVGLCKSYTDAIDRHIEDLDLADWEAELDRPYNWQDDGL